MENYIIWFKDCSYKNKNLVGGKCSSLGELYYLSKKLYFSIADGYAITTKMYDDYIRYNNLEEIIKNKLEKIDTTNIKELEEESKYLKNLIISGDFISEHKELILNSYRELSNIYRKKNLEVAVRSSAIAEDLPNASFAGQQDTLLNISEENLINSIKICFASLFNSRAISYRKTHSIKIEEVKISVAIQKMVRSDLGSAGVAFSIDPETGYNKAIVINGAFGLGELVVSGGVKPDEYILDKRVLRDIEADPIIMKKKGEKNSKIVYKKNDNGTEEIETSQIEKINYCLTNHQAITLGRYVLLLEQNYSKMFGKNLGVDVEWALDGYDQNIYIIQTRPETIHSNEKNYETKKYVLDEKSDILISGIAIGEKISFGKVKLLKSIDEYERFEKGDILVTEMTTPDWEPIMKIAGGIITDKGGRTCHSAIVARELGLNAIVGTSNATKILKENKVYTVNCSEGETGYIHEGELRFHIDKIQLIRNKLPVKLMMNIGNPEMSFSSSMLPNDGVGLVRMEFIINNYIQVHPNALLDYPNLPKDIKDKVYNKLDNYDNGESYFIEHLARGLAQIASAFMPNDVVVRFSDFKSNEYKQLLGGILYEPDEENPLISFRGCSRYYSDEYKDAFSLECKAIKYCREVMNMTNIIVMLPFCRTPEECKKVIEIMENNELKRAEGGLQVYIMCEIPSNVIEADEFSPYIDGISIGSNDLLMLTLGIDRDSEKVAHLSNHTNLSYRRLLRQAIQQYKKNGKKVGLCGQQASDSIEFCEFLIDCGIDSISVVPDSVIRTINNLKSLNNNK
jgi:pyruvate,water dikinase